MSDLHHLDRPWPMPRTACLRGLRIRVHDVLVLLAARASRNKILAYYPILEVGDIIAALEYTRQDIVTVQSSVLDEEFA